MKHRHNLLMLSMGIFASPMIVAKAPFKGLNTLFSNNHEETIKKEFTPTSATPTTLSIDNSTGSIKITAEPKQTSIALTAHKRAPSSAQLDTILISDSQQNDTITVKTVYAKDKHEGTSVDYEALVPLGTNVQLTTAQGPITVNCVSGTIQATTNDGTIELANTIESVTAKADKAGSILIHEAHGPINAQTTNGSIYIDAAHHTILAQTTKGRIEVRCSDLPAASSLHLTTKEGPILLYVPETIAADIQGKTEHATLTCQCPITLKPFTTTLNQKAWKRFKQEVSGTIGTADLLAHINLESVWGTIKIMPS